MIKLKLPKLNSVKTKRLLPITAIVLLLGLMGYLGYDYYSTQKELAQYVDDTDVKALKEKNELMKRLNEITILPQNEEPTIATVADAFRLRGQKFFENAINGDKVIIYTKAQRAILFRPSQNKIVESAPINLSDITNTVQGQEEVAGTNTSSSENYVLDDTQKKAEPEEKEPEPAEPEEPAKLAIYNGTLFVAGLANDVGDYLTKSLGEDKISIEILKNAPSSYDETIIFDVSEKYTELAKQIEGMLQGKIIEKLEGIDYPEVDLVIIAGKDIDLDNLIN